MAKRDSTSQLNHETRRVTVNSQRGNTPEQRFFATIDTDVQNILKLVATVSADVQSVFKNERLLQTESFYILDNEDLNNSLLYIYYLLNKKKVEDRNKAIYKKMMEVDDLDDLEDLEDLVESPEVTLTPKTLAILNKCNTSELLDLSQQIDRCAKDTNVNLFTTKELNDYFSGHHNSKIEEHIHPLIDEEYEEGA